MCETKLKLQVVLIVLCLTFKGFLAVDDCKHILSCVFLVYYEMFPFIGY